MIALYSGPTTMAPTTRICELVRIPTHAINAAMTSRTKKLGAYTPPARIPASTISQTGAISPCRAPGRSAEGSASVRAASTVSTMIEPRPVQAEAAQLPEHRVGRAVPEIELDRVAVRPPRRPLQHHQVQHARVCGERLDQAAGHLRRARDADMQHRKIVGRPAAASITRPE